jgi:hypothetical protein
MIIRTGVMLICLGTLLVGCHHDSALMSDNLEACVAPDGKEYSVDANTQHCPAADVSVRCRMPNAPLIHTRRREECLRKGGYPLGEKPPTGWPNQPENSH